MPRVIALAFMALFIVAAPARADEIAFGTLFVDQAYPASTTSLVISPSANTGGLSLKTASLSYGSSTIATLIAAYPDGTLRPIQFNSPQGTTLIPYPLSFPPGVGIAVTFGPIAFPGESGPGGTVVISYDLH